VDKDEVRQASMHSIVGQASAPQNWVYCNDMNNCALCLTKTSLCERQICMPCLYYISSILGSEQAEAHSGENATGYLTRLAGFYFGALETRVTTVMLAGLCVIPDPRVSRRCHQ
jgi:hypothetical protein